MLPLVLATLLLSVPGAQERLPTSAPFRQPKLASDRNGKVVLTGKRFEVHAHFDDVWAAKSALEAVETVWPIAMEYLDAPGIEPPYPLEVHLYPTLKDYTDVEAILTEGWFRNTGSFAHWPSKTAHIAMAPPLAGRAADKIVLSGQTREVLLHEAAHLAVYVVIPTYRWHPVWFAEGLAMCVEQKAARRLGMLGELSEHPRYSTDQVLLQRLMERDALPKLGSLLAESLDTLSFHERYALHLEFFSMIVEDYPEDYGAMIKEAKRLRGGGAFRQGISEFMVRTFDREELSSGLRKRIRGLTPAWYIDYRALDIEGDRWTQAAFPDTPAVAWRTEPVGRRAFAIEGGFELLGPEMSVLLNRVGSEYLSIALRAEGVIVISKRGIEGSEELARAACETLGEEGKHAFRVDVLDGRVSVWVDGTERIEVDAGESSLGGNWGLAVPPSGAGLWHGVEIAR